MADRTATYKSTDLFLDGKADNAAIYRGRSLRDDWGVVTKFKFA